jgi:parvulin-like peptidyl-prolyl isomerase
MFPTQTLSEEDQLMTETLGNPKLQSLRDFVVPEIYLADDDDIIACLRRTHKLAEIATLAERDALILNLCEQLDICVSETELQTAGDAFRQENQLLEASATLAWLQKQRIAVEDWSEGIRRSLLTEKLKDYLFGDAVDAHYINNRNDYNRVALSQILVSDLTIALKVAYAIREEKVSFCALALEYSKGKQSRENGGFVGIRFLLELMPEIAQAVAEANEGEVIGPVQTKLGYHVLKIEKRFHAELNEIREQVLESLFQNWLQVDNSVLPDEQKQ